MQPRFLVLLATAFACGMVATISINHLTKRVVEQSPEAVQIYVANENIEGGSKLKPAQFTLTATPFSRMPEGAILNVAQFDEKYLKQNLFAGEPLVECKITSARGGFSCLPLLPPEEIDRIIAEIVANRSHSSDAPQ